VSQQEKEKEKVEISTEIFLLFYEILTVWNFAEPTQQNQSFQLFQVVFFFSTAGKRCSYL